MRATARKKPCQDEALGVIARAENRVSVRWKDIAPTMRSATVAIEDKPLLGARRARLARHRARGAQQPAGGRHPPGRLDDLAAAREEPLPAARGEQPLAQPQDRRGLDRGAAAGQVHEGRDPHGLPQHRLLRRERLRRGGRGAHVLRQDREAAHARAVGAAGRAAAGAERLQPVPAPGGRARKRRSEVLQAHARRCAGSAPTPTRGRCSAPARPQARELRHRGLLAVRVRPGAPGARRAAAGQARGARRPARLLDGRPAAAVRGAACDQGRAQVAGRSARRRSSRSTCTTATCSRSAPPTTARPPTSSTSRPPGTARRARRSSCSRSSTRCAAGPIRARSTTRRATSRSPRTTRSARSPAAGRRDNAEGDGGGYMSLETATVHSVNVVYAQLMRDLGPGRWRRPRTCSGIRSKLPLHCSMVLGADDVTPLELTSAYATIAAGGVYHRAAHDPARRGRGGQDRGRQAPSACRPSASSATGVAVRGDADPQGGRDRRAPGTRARLDDGRPEAGKTGTAENYGNAWFCGYTPDIAVVRVGRLPLVEQAAREHRGLRRGLRRHAPGGDLEGLHDDGDARACRRTTGRSPSIRWSSSRSRRRPRSATTRRRRRRRPRPGQAKPKPKQRRRPPAPPTPVVIAPQNG